jgi:hypothetical protein
MSSNPLLLRSRSSSTDSSRSSDMSGKDDTEAAGGLELVNSQEGVSEGVPIVPSEVVSSKKQRISDLWTILCAGCALISDGYANSLMTLINVVLKAQYPTIYTSSVSTRISNALLIGEILGQITIG